MDESESGMFEAVKKLERGSRSRRSVVVIIRLPMKVKVNFSKSFREAVGVRGSVSKRSLKKVKIKN